MPIGMPRLGARGTGVAGAFDVVGVEGTAIGATGTTGAGMLVGTDVGAVCVCAGATRAEGVIGRGSTFGFEIGGGSSRTTTAGSRSLVDETQAGTVRIARKA